LWLDFKSLRHLQAYGGISARPRVGIAAAATSWFDADPNRLRRAEMQRDQRRVCSSRPAAASKNLAVNKRCGAAPLFGAPLVALMSGILDTQIFIRRHH